jgi:hypothetical protein
MWPVFRHCCDMSELWRSPASVLQLYQQKGQCGNSQKPDSLRSQKKTETRHNYVGHSLFVPEAGIQGLKTFLSSPYGFRSTTTNSEILIVTNNQQRQQKITSTNCLKLDISQQTCKTSLKGLDTAGRQGFDAWYRQKISTAPTSDPWPQSEADHLPPPSVEI